MATPMTNLGLVQQCCCLLAAILTEERAIVDEKTIEAVLHPLPHLVARRRPRAGGARPVRQIPPEARRPAARRPRRRGGHRPAPQLARVARRLHLRSRGEAMEEVDGRGPRVRAAHRRQVLVDHGADVGHSALDVAARYGGDGERRRSSSSASRARRRRRSSKSISSRATRRRSRRSRRTSRAARRRRTCRSVSRTCWRSVRRTPSGRPPARSSSSSTT